MRKEQMHKVTILSDLVFFQRGFDITKAQQRAGDIPVVSSSGIKSYHSIAKVKGPGVVIGRKGTLGSIHFIKEDYWPHDTTLWSKNFKGNNPRFVYYFLKVLRLAHYNVGNANPTLNRNHIHGLKIIIPPLNTQLKIASILSAYDDLIENNRQRIQLLEESARLLYKEWFVNFRFPGHENTKIVDGVPEGWERKPLVEVAHLTMGQSPKSEFYNDAGDGLPFHQGVTNYGERFVSHKIYSTKITRLAESGDILCSVRAPVGRLNYTLDKIILGRGLCAIFSKFENQSFLFYQLKNYFFKEDIIGSGAIYAAVTKKDMETLELLKPPVNIVRSFEEISRPFDKQIKNLSEQNQKLAEARDFLLPRLITGEVEV